MSRNAFAAAVDAIFRDHNVAAEATYVDGLGVASPIRVIRRRPDEVTEWGGGQWVSDSDLLEIRVSDAPQLSDGDRIFIGGESLKIAGDPRRDADRLVWTAQVTPA